jgi:hypothetical protein
VAFSLMSMLHDSRFLVTAMGLVGLIVLLALHVVPVRGGDVFQCPDGKGGSIWRDVPCSAPAPDPPPSTPSPAPAAPSRTREAAVPSAGKRVPSTPGKTLTQQSSDCLRVRSVKARRQSPDPLAVELAWEVAVQNHCQQSVSAVLTFTIYSSRNLALDSDSAKIVVAADGVGTINGLMRVSREKIRHMSKYDAKLSVM